MALLQVQITEYM